MYVGDDQQHQVVSVKTIIIHLHFNHITIVSDVMHILSLAKKLISYVKQQNKAKIGYPSSMTIVIYLIYLSK
jgi:hypothetical protein